VELEGEAALLRSTEITFGDLATRRGRIIQGGEAS
jgi:hypothetical protein